MPIERGFGCAKPELGMVMMMASLVVVSVTSPALSDGSRRRQRRPDRQGPVGAGDRTTGEARFWNATAPERARNSQRRPCRWSLHAPGPTAPCRMAGLRRACRRMTGRNWISKGHPCPLWAKPSASDDVIAMQSTARCANHRTCGLRNPAWNPVEAGRVHHFAAGQTAC